ncbi:MAG TPA: AraC family transcriptional regulator [Blastocatellia bacterium]|nr:AraC family transcriptional regulator [Blastocatellia bacterium]
MAPERLLSAVGIPKNLIAAPDGRVPVQQVFSLWEEAQKHSNDRLITSHTVEFLPFGAYKIMDYLIAAGSTPREGLKKFIRNFRLVNGAFELQFTTQNGQPSLELQNPFDSEESSRLYLEFIFLAIQSRLRFTTGVDWRPEEVHFIHPPPHNRPDYHQAFHCPVRFNKAMNRMLLNDRSLDIPQLQADPLLCEMLDHHAQRLLKQLPVEDDFLSDLRSALCEGLYRGDVRLKTTARKLALSYRALQRKLKEQGTSYQEALDHLRHELAVDLLTERQIEIEEISHFLGFSEPSSFYRAFRRWTGETPQEYLRLPS